MSKNKCLLLNYGFISIAILCYNMKIEKGKVLMLSFIDELQKHYDLVIYLIIGVIFIFFLIVFFLFFNKKKKYMNKLEKLKAEFKKIDELPITTALTKIEELGMRNISFSSMSSIYVKRYLDYSDKSEALS